MKNNLIQKVQKILYFAFLIASFGVLISSFCFFNKSWRIFQTEGPDVYINNFVNQIRKAILLGDKNYKGSFSIVFADDDIARHYYVNFWDQIQNANNLLFSIGVSGLAMVAISAILGNFGRRKYYITNLISGCVTGLVGIILSLITVVKCVKLKSCFATIIPDCERLGEYAEKAKMAYEPVEYGNCNIGIVIGLIYIVLCCVIIAFTIFKYVKSIQIKKMEAVLNETI